MAMECGSFDKLLLCGGAAIAERTAIVVAGERTTWAELTRLGQAIEGELRGVSGRRVGLIFRACPACFMALAILDRLGCDVFLLDGDINAADADRLAEEYQFAGVIAAASNEGGGFLQVTEFPDRAGHANHSSVTILTSGTTGKPKAVRHTWASLCRPVRSGSADDQQRWLLSYRPHLYAGLQVAMQCFANRGTLVVPASNSDPAEVAKLLVTEAVQFVSATPAYWRRMLMLADPATLRSAPLRQITLGGEVVDEQILQALHAAFPEARIVHIYATTELGRCFSVTDGRAGFPAKFLQSVSPDGVDLKIESGELLARSANSMQGYHTGASSETSAASDGWRRTGDLVELRDDRVYFIGRSSDIINVGGNKVSPIEVEQVVRSVRGVRDVRVYGRRSSVVGQIVACDVVIAPGADPKTVLDEIGSTCLGSLNSAQRPRLIEFVDSIDLSSAGKTIRRSSN
jgi:acyl-CoA synthetase (AMP-forming)/AMP-acid ligase II